MDRSELLQHLEEILEAGSGADYCPNGLQVEGRSEIRKVVTGVSACQELFESARQAGADAIIVHHGLFWFGMPYPLTGLHYRRVATLIREGINLLAYHLPLDRHPTLGNNAVAARALGLERLRPFAYHDGHPIGFGGDFPQPIAPRELVRRAEAFYGQEALSFLDGPDPLRSVAVLSGGAPKEIHRALDEGYDAFVSGEATELVMNVAREGGIHFLACGHYATERCGIQALGNHLKDTFGLDVEFIDVPNPV